MNYITLLLVKFQTDNLEANIWIISTIKWQQHFSVYVQESEGKTQGQRIIRSILKSTKGVVSLLRLLAHTQ